MIELDDEGRLDGGWISFNNLYNNDARHPLRLSGLVGRCSKFNAGEEPRYFLFAGSHIFPSDPPDGKWFQSDCRLRFESDSLLVVGWDDRGYTPANEPSPAEAKGDRDYNDMVATIHFTQPEDADAAPPTNRAIVEYQPAPIIEAKFGNDETEGFKLQVNSGQILVLDAACNAELQNRISIIELLSRRIIWQDEGKPYVAGTPQPGDRGIYVIRNNSDQTMCYEVQVHHHDYGEFQSDPWRANEVKLLAGGKDFAYFGFEDNPHVANRRDFQDVNVIAHWIDLQSNPIEKTPPCEATCGEIVRCR
jgi:hypothetical protein